MEENKIGIDELKEFVVNHCEVIGRVTKNIQDGGKYTGAEAITDGLFSIPRLRDAYKGAQDIKMEFLDLTEEESKEIVNAGAAAFIAESGLEINTRAVKIAEHFLGLAVEITNLVIGE